MSFAEKNTWIYGALTLIVPGAYFIWLASRLRLSPAADIAYRTPLLAAVGIAVLTSIVARIVVAAARPSEGDRRDQRDREIYRLGEFWAYYVLSAGAVAALALAMIGAAQFWIANTLYLGFVLASLTASAVQLLAYRGRIQP